MTREQILSLTYPFPPQGAYRECHLRLLTLPVTPDHTADQRLTPKPQVAFSGPCDADDLRRGLRWRDHWRQDVQVALEEGSISGPAVELLERAILGHLEALEKAIPLAEAGWKIYLCDLYVAVLVPPGAVP